ncbi:hypothetical protein BDW69DRAFT_184713 [Aspergillus filifer]
MPHPIHISYELWVLIFESCDGFSQVTALASICKTLYFVWLGEQSRIIQQAGESCIMAFEDDVLTIRATGLVMEHLERGELPPSPIPLNRLATHVKGFALEELDAVFKIHPCRIDQGSTLRGGMQSDRFHCAFYRCFLAGAVLCEIYQGSGIRTSWGPIRPASFVEELDEEMAEDAEYGTLMNLAPTTDHAL